MKKILLLFLILLSIQRADSQVAFCPSGAEWHYRFNTFFGEVYNEQIKYVRDSVIGNETVKVLEHFSFFKCQNLAPGQKLTLIKQKGDTVFMSNLSTLNSWQILYNYGAVAGQSWQNNISVFITTPTTLAVTYTITVDSVKINTINSMNLRELYVKYYSQYASPSTGYDQVVITERFGCSQFLFNFYNKIFVSDYEIFTGFLCYQDDTFGLKQFTDKPCNYVDYVGIETNYQNSSVKTYPNPATEILNISSEGQLFNGEILVSFKDLYGREIKAVALNELNSTDHKIEISDIASGLYVLSIKNRGKEIYTGKFVKD
ncbi:MAG: T9SS type A sorting domain-containing protein [Bacteroidota bacterium]